MFRQGHYHDYRIFSPYWYGSILEKYCSHNFLHDCFSFKPTAEITYVHFNPDVKINPFMVLILLHPASHTATQSQKAGTAYFSSPSSTTLAQH